MGKFFLTNGMYYGILIHMKIKNKEIDLLKTEFQKKLKSLYPVARGSLSLVRKPCGNPNCTACRSGERHPSWIFTFRKDGKHQCMHVQPRHVETVRKAIENGRLLEDMILGEGIALLEKLREED